MTRFAPSMRTFLHRKGKRESVGTVELLLETESLDQACDEGYYETFSCFLIEISPA